LDVVGVVNVGVGVVDVGEEVGMNEFAGGEEEPERGRGLVALTDIRVGG
jgi:hypothetical protein